MASLKGEWIAPQAAIWLADADSPRVHSIFNQSVNLIDQEKSLLSVVLPSLGPGPFAIVVAPDAAGFPGFQELQIDSRVQLLPEMLHIGDVEIQISQATTWNPSPGWEELGTALNPSLIDQLRLLLATHSPPGSFAPLVSGIAQDQEPTIQAKALQTAFEPSRRLMKGLMESDIAVIESAAGDLTGLGGGVTPSGDDYLQGVIHALWTKLSVGQAERLGNAIANVAHPRTNAISGEWLKAAARGEAGEDWHLLANALEEDVVFEQTATRLILRGHTSGADAMAGYISSWDALS